MSTDTKPLYVRKRPSALLPPVFMKLPGSAQQPWVPRFEGHFDQNDARNMPSGRCSPVTSDCASSLFAPPSPELVFTNASFLDLGFDDEGDQLATVRASSFVLPSHLPSPVASVAAFIVSSQKRRPSAFQPAEGPCQPDAPVARKRHLSTPSMDMKISKRSEPIMAVDALESYFGSSGESAKAQRCGYGGVGIANTAKDWNRMGDFQPLLKSREVSSSTYTRHLPPTAVKRRSRGQLRRKFQERGGQPLQLARRRSVMHQYAVDDTLPSPPSASLPTPRTRLSTISRFLSRPLRVFSPRAGLSRQPSIFTL